jgi:hypothetical protein
MRLFEGSSMKIPVAFRQAAPFAALLAIASVAALSAGTAGPKDDEGTLRALHAKVLRAHRESNPDLLLEGAAEDFVQANRGEIRRPTLQERRTRFADYLGRTTFEVYRDAAEPVVKVSKDGTLGWVIAQVEARGVQTGDDGRKEPLEFVSAWIELYEKRGGRWVSTGNLSNFK